MNKSHRKKEIKLFPCPFCGSPGEIKPYMGDECAGCSNDRCAAYSITFTIDEWNRRA